MKLKAAAVLVCLALLTACASTNAVRLTSEQRLWETQRMQQAHPDVANRMAAIYWIDSGDEQQAQQALDEAARFADKPSQALLAERYWNGDGIAQDRIRGYAWMHLAAERDYPFFRAKRDVYWNALSEQQREDALAVVAELAATYADVHAKPRATEVMEKTARVVLGPSPRPRGGAVLIPSGYNWLAFSGELYFNDRYWNADSYFEWTDKIWREAPVGSVDIGEIGLIKTETAD